MWYVADGCTNGGLLAYFSSFTIVKGAMEHLIENKITLQRVAEHPRGTTKKTALTTP